MKIKIIFRKNEFNDAVVSGLALNIYNWSLLTVRFFEYFHFFYLLCSQCLLIFVYVVILQPEN
jgi:hypothetical protein